MGKYRMPDRVRAHSIRTSGSRSEKWISRTTLHTGALAEVVALSSP